MWIRMALRSLLVLELLACITLYVSKQFGFEAFADAYVMSWVFIFAYPMAFLGFGIFAILSLWNVALFLKLRNNIYLKLIAFDITIVLVAYFVFQAYYNKIV